MSKLRQHIEEMRARLDEVAHDEEALVKALGDALNRLDDALLRDVRTIATEHEARREQILGELQTLASGIAMFRPPLEQEPPREELPSYMPQNSLHNGAHNSLHGAASHNGMHAEMQNGSHHGAQHHSAHMGHGEHATVAPGDWRQATSNIDDEPVFDLDGLEALSQRH